MKIKQNEQNVVFLCLGIIGIVAATLGIVMRGEEVIAAGAFIIIVSFVFVVTSLCGILSKKITKND